MAIFSRSFRKHHSTTTTAVWSDRHVCVVAAATIASIIIYGSLIPFDFHAPGSIHPSYWLQQIRFTTERPGSATDLLVNLTTGVPLGFFLMGAWRSGRPRSRVGALVAVLFVGGLSAGLAVTVELLQLLSSIRISSWRDVMGQVLGASAGAVAWPLAGPAVVAWLRSLLNDEPFSFAVHLLQLYVPIYLFMQLSPLEAELPARRIPPLPFGFYSVFGFPVVRNYVGSALLNVPIGALAVLAHVRRRRRPSVATAVLVGVSSVIAIEIAHCFIWSHAVDVINIFCGAFGLVFGVVAALEWARSAGEHGSASLNPNKWFFLAAAGWILVLMAELWYPYDFQLKLEVLKARIPYIPLLPFASYYPSFSSIPLKGLRALLRRFLLGVPLGLLLQMAWPVAAERNVRQLQAVGIAGLSAIVFVGIAIGEIFVPSGYPDVTEVVLGVAGATLGAQALQRSPVRMSGSGGGSSRPPQAPQE